MDYTKNITDYITKEYQADPTRSTVDRLAEEFEVSPRSIIGKLSSLKVYQKEKKLNKAGKPVELKRDLAAEIAEMFGLELPSLVKAEREELRLLRDALINSDNLNALLVDLSTK